MDDIDNTFREMGEEDMTSNSPKNGWCLIRDLVDKQEVATCGATNENRFSLSARASDRWKSTTSLNQSCTTIAKINSTNTLSNSVFQSTDSFVQFHSHNASTNSLISNFLKEQTECCLDSLIESFLFDSEIEIKSFRKQPRPSSPAYRLFAAPRILWAGYWPSRQKLEEWTKGLMTLILVSVAHDLLTKATNSVVSNNRRLPIVDVFKSLTLFLVYKHLWEPMTIADKGDEGKSGWQAMTQKEAIDWMLMW
eukprot:Platyproteum_vivax@DN3604_c0_g1_i1.p1